MKLFYSDIYYLNSTKARSKIRNNRFRYWNIKENNRFHFRDFTILLNVIKISNWWINEKYELWQFISAGNKKKNDKWK